MIETMWGRKILLAVIAVGMGWSLPGQGEAGELPSFVNWSNEGAYREDSGPREALSLNGWWRWKQASDSDTAVPEDGWQWRRAPGIGVNFSIRTDNGQDFLADRNYQDRLDLMTGPCWIEREFTIPTEWEGRSVDLVFDNILGDGAIYLDGKLMGHTWEKRAHHLPLPTPYRTDAPYRLTIRSHGAVNNLWLKSYASNDDQRILDSYLTTSVSERAATIKASGTGPAGTKVRVVVTEYKQPDQVVKTVGPFEVKVEDGRWNLEERFAWEDARLWSLSHPNLYQYHLDLLDADGNVMDRILPIRFGFRELWIRGGDFMLNQRRITLLTDTHCPAIAVKLGSDKAWSKAGNFAREDIWREAIQRWKILGVNGVTHRGSSNVDDDMLFRVADEEGFFIAIATAAAQNSNPIFAQVPRIQKHTEDETRYLVLPRRHSPSLSFYYLLSTGNTWDFEPSKLGEDYDVEKLFGRHSRFERALLNTLDTARVAYSGSGGGLSEPVHSSMNYLHIDADLQVHETWPSYWYLHKRKPLATYEQAAPPYIADWYMRRSRGEQAHTTQGVLPFFLEISAIYLGEDAYRIEPRENMETWLDRAGTDQNQMSPMWSVRSYEEVAKLFTRNVYRAWRTYGVNFTFFTQIRSYWGGEPVVVAPIQGDVRRPGLLADKPVSLVDPFRTAPLTPVGEVARDALAPLLMYIGGPDGAFTRKDRAFFAGQPIRKAVVVLNDRDDPALVGGQWELCDTNGTAVLSGTLDELELAPGELAPARLHIEFAAPAVSERTDYTLKLHGRSETADALSDEFPLAVFPAPAQAVVAEGMNIFLYDPLGETAKMLNQAGVRYTLVGNTLPPPENSLLIIGRNALKDEAHRKAFARLLYSGMGYDFGINVSNGMRVLVFEQAMENVWGLKAEETRWRRAFIGAPGHPALSGLGKDDFIYLSGNSSLAEAYPPAPDGKPGRVATDRSSEWGNDNVVTTFSFVRPQAGAARALLFCGFDLQETPLLEAVGGTGRMMFCQVDVTGRYGTDPVSTRLVNNLIAYMTSAEPPDPSIGKPVDLVREGWDEYDVPIHVEKKFYMADKPAGPISWGISAADLYFEGYVELPVIQGPNGERYLYGPIDGETSVAHTLNRRNFTTRWQKMKSLMALTALRINQGGSSSLFPNISLQGDNETLYPMEWLEGFVHPYLMMQW